MQLLPLSAPAPCRRALYLHLIPRCPAVLQVVANEFYDASGRFSQEAWAKTLQKTLQVHAKHTRNQCAAAVSNPICFARHSKLTRNSFAKEHKGFDTAGSRKFRHRAQHRGNVCLTSMQKDESMQKESKHRRRAAASSAASTSCTLHCSAWCPPWATPTPSGCRPQPSAGVGTLRTWLCCFESGET